MVTVDIAKAFNKVQHSAFLSTLIEKGIHPLFADTVSMLYDGVTTTFSNGVKQGDPLFPLLFII